MGRLQRMKSTSNKVGRAPSRSPSGTQKTPAQPKPRKALAAKAPATRKPPSRFDYDVCVSFAGENRALVKAVVDSLKRRRLKCFYDNDEQATLIGKDLIVYLDEVYRKKARYCVMFISEHYVVKLWTNHERKSIQARMFESKDDYLIPVRLDDADVPGVLSTIGYLDGRHHSVAEIATLIQKKVRGSVAPKKPASKPKSVGSARSVNWTYMTNLRRLRKALADPVAVALLDITSARAGQAVPFSEVLRLAGVGEARRGMTALGLLTKAIKREFGLPTEKVAWPVERLSSADGTSQTSYRMSPEVAQAWLSSKP